MTERRLQVVATLAVLVMTCCVLPSQAITADFALGTTLAASPTLLSFLRHLCSLPPHPPLLAVDADQSVSNVIFSRFGLEQGGVVKVSAAIDVRARHRRLSPQAPPFFLT